jgi:hypothetical protein
LENYNKREKLIQYDVEAVIKPTLGGNHIGVQIACMLLLRTEIGVLIGRFNHKRRIEFNTHAILASPRSMGILLIWKTHI